MKTIDNRQAFFYLTFDTNKSIFLIKTNIVNIDSASSNNTNPNVVEEGLNYIDNNKKIWFIKNNDYSIQYPYLYKESGEYKLRNSFDDVVNETSNLTVILKLDNLHHIEFTLGTKNINNIFKVITVDPVDGEINVPSNKEIFITFNHDADESTIDENSFFITYNSYILEDGRWDATGEWTKSGRWRAS